MKIQKYKIKIKVLTGLHIGAGKGGDFEIGGMDNPVVKDFETGYPYIPGSSLKGKLRSLLEIKYGNDQEKLNLIETLFGKPAEEKKDQRSSFNYTVVLIRDLFVDKKTEEIIEKLKKQGKAITEEKMEVSLYYYNKQTGKRERSEKTSPRPSERVPKGYSFEGEVVFRFFDEETKQKESQLVELFKEGILLLNEDYLGGSGSRGYGRVQVELLETNE